MSLSVYSLIFNMFAVNTYIVADSETNECAIIDPGMMNEQENKKLSDFILHKNLNPVVLVNTHLHIDHVMGNTFVTSKYGLQPHVNDADMFLGGRISQQAAMFGLPLNVPNVEHTVAVSENDMIKIGNSELKVIHVPGHSPGSIVLYSKKDGFIICGDVLFQQSIGRTDLPGGNYQTLISGIQKKLLCLPETTSVFPGHGESTDIGTEKNFNPYL